MRITFLTILVFIANFSFSQDQNTGDQLKTAVLITETSKQYDVLVESDQCDFTKGAVRSCKAKLTILPKGKSTPIQAVNSFVHMSEDGAYITRFEDFNFDGHEDFIVHDIFNDNTVYLCDPSKKQFVISESFSAIVAGTNNFRIASDEKTILVTIFPGEFYKDVTRYYRSVDNEPVLVKEEAITFDIDPFQPFFNFIKSERVGSEWKTTVTKMPRPDQGDWVIPVPNKAVWKKEVVNITGASSQFNIAMELPCLRDKTKKNEISDSYYEYRPNKPATILLKDKTSGKVIHNIQAKGIALFLYDQERAADGTFSWAYDRQHWIRFSDVNFDGTEDLLVISKASDQIKRYDVYLFSQADNRFTYSADFTALNQRWWDLDLIDGAFTFSIDSNAKTLTVRHAGGNEAEARTYSIVDGKPHLIGLSKTVGKFKMTKELVEGRWKKMISE